MPTESSAGNRFIDLIESRRFVGPSSGKPLLFPADLSKDVLAPQKCNQTGTPPEFGFHFFEQRNK